MMIRMTKSKENGDYGVPTFDADADRDGDGHGRCMIDGCADDSFVVDDDATRSRKPKADSTHYHERSSLLQDIANTH